MKNIDRSDFETAGANFGEKVAKSFYSKYDNGALTLHTVLRRVPSECLISADSSWIIEKISRVSTIHKKMITNICNALNNRITKDFPVIEDDFNFEDDFADEYGDSPANVYNIAFWDAFGKTLLKTH